MHDEREEAHQHIVLSLGSLIAPVPNENHENGGLGWSRGALGGALGAILELLEELWDPFWTQGCPKLKNHRKSDLVTPPPGDQFGS